MRTRIMVAAVFGAVAVGCASSGAPEPALTATPTPAESTASAGVSPTPSPSASAEAPPAVDLTAEDGDYQRVVEEILRFREWLFAHPHRQDLVSVIYNEDCPCYDGLIELLQSYADAGHRIVEGRLVVLSFELVESDAVSSRVRLTWRGEDVVAVDETDNEVERIDESDPLSEEWLLLRDPNGRFRVAGQVDA